MWVFVKVLFAHNISPMRNSLQSYWWSMSMSGFASNMIMTQTHNKCTECRPILTEIPAWLSCLFEWKDVCEERPAQWERDVFRSLRIGFRRESSTMDSLCKTVYPFSQNLPVISSSITWNLPNDTVRFKLHGQVQSLTMEGTVGGYSWAWRPFKFRRMLGRPDIWRFLCTLSLARGK